MFVEVNRDQAKQMAALARGLRPDEVQLNTPLRPSPIRPLPSTEMEAVEAAFAGLPTINVYTAQRPEVQLLNTEATCRRRPARAARLVIERSESQSAARGNRMTCGAGR